MNPNILKRSCGFILALAAFLTLRSAQAEPNPDRDVFYGETHVHTSWSFDAFIFGNHLTGPADAYKYAMGDVIKHPLGYDIKITTPLDWMGVTDHSEYVGTVRLANEPGSFLSKLPIAEKLIVHDPADIQRIYLWLGTAMIEGKPVKELVVPEIAGTVWMENVQIADQFNKPGKFTAFCSYEWTSTPNFSNMHPISSSRTQRRSATCLSARSIPRIRKTCGPGRMPSVRLATSCWPSRTTRT
jgi:hypothetical protein